MDLEKIIETISSVGFPIVMTGALCYYIVTVQGKTNEALEKINQTLAVITQAILGGGDDEK